VTEPLVLNVKVRFCQDGPSDPSDLQEIALMSSCRLPLGAETRRAAAVYHPSDRAKPVIWRRCEWPEGFSLRQVGGRVIAEDA
jgi:hypothetical protein